MLEKLNIVWLFLSISKQANVSSDFQLTKNNVSFETEGHIGQALKVFDQHANVCTGNSVDDFATTDSLDVFGSLISNKSVVKDIRACPALGSLLNRYNNHIEGFMAHLFLQIGQGMLQDSSYCILKVMTCVLRV